MKNFSKKRILTVIGARPQFVKAAVLSRALQNSCEIAEYILHTGQHFDINMSDAFFKELKLPTPKYNLNINSGLHGQMTGRMVEAIENVLYAEKPNAVLVYGDTNSTLAGALAAAKLNIPVIHVEAGLRSFNKNMPEEINRILTDHISSILFCPTRISVKNLEKEGIIQGVHHFGDVMYDAALHAIDYAKNNKELIGKLSFLPAKFAFMTVHRQESTDCDNSFQKIINFAIDFSLKNDLKIVFPVHPRIKSFIQNTNIPTNLLMLTEPLSYFETHYCLSKAKYVLTDSGGLQKEAYFHRVPCITLRSETEWLETIESGWNKLWVVNDYLPRKDISDYGDGNCAKLIVRLIKEKL